jgi:hypothetical protein
MKNDAFDTSLRDSQATDVDPVSPDAFDAEEYADYEAGLLERCRAFWKADSGVAVHRRVRVASVFSDGCKDMAHSLALQLGALKKSMEYKMDIPNFLEPWYGIGWVAGSFGAEYVWREGQAPDTGCPFKSVEDTAAVETVPVEDTPIGQHILRMTEYFLEKTRGKLPMGLTDISSSLDVASVLIEANNLYLAFYDNPKGLQDLFRRIDERVAGFAAKQWERIGDRLAKPGHGFSSSRAFEGLGISGDTMLMVSNELYERYEVPSLEAMGERFGGVVFHSCGNWTDRIPVIKKISNLRMIDAAFGPRTDPSPNPPERFADEFSGTGIVVNARIVGDARTVLEQVRKLWKPGMKLIVVTYCKSPGEQEKVYRSIHDLCGGA